MTSSGSSKFLPRTSAIASSGRTTVSPTSAIARIAWPSAIGIVAMKMETGSPMSSTPIVCQKPSTSNAHTIDADDRGDHPEDPDERRDERPCAQRSVLRHVPPPSRLR